MRSEANIKTSFLDAQAEIRLPKSVTAKCMASVDWDSIDNLGNLQDSNKIASIAKPNDYEVDETNLLSSAKGQKYGIEQSSKGIHNLRTNQFNGFESKPTLTAYEEPSSPIKNFDAILRSPTVIADEICETNQASPVIKKVNRENALDLMRGKLSETGLNKMRVSSNVINTIQSNDVLDKHLIAQ